MIRSTGTTPEFYINVTRLHGQRSRYSHISGVSYLIIPNGLSPFYYLEKLDVTLEVSHTQSMT